jgi:small subunit ribosomal protein S17
MADTEAKSAATEAKKALKNEKVGEVVSTKMQKTIVVEVSRRVPHPLYKRIIKKRKKFYAHDEQGTANLGDVVRIIECRPLSKLKRWQLLDIVRRAPQVAVAPKDLDVKVESRGSRRGAGSRWRLRLRAGEGG